MKNLDISYYLELQKRLQDILLYVSFSEKNMNTYSIKIENLFVDISAFFDSLCQTFIVENSSNDLIFGTISKIDYQRKIDGLSYFNMTDYREILETVFEFSNKEVNVNIHEDY